jgi:signal transduction histidine kinase
MAPWADCWAWVLAVLAVVTMFLLVPDVPVWAWNIVPFALAVVVIAVLVVSVRIPHQWAWSSAGALAFAVAVVLGFSAIHGAIIVLVYPLARYAIDRIRHDGGPLVAYAFLAGRMVLGVLAGGLAAWITVGTSISSRGDSDLTGLIPFSVGYLVFQLIAIGGVQLAGLPEWVGRRDGRLSRLGIPQLAQVVIWEAVAVIGATATALIIDSVSLRLDYWVSCLLALVIIIALHVTLDRNTLLRERNDDLARALAELRALNDVSRALTATYEAGALVEEIGGQVRRVLDADVVEIARLDPIRGRLRFLFAAHAGVRQPERFEQVPPEPSGPEDLEKNPEPGIVFRSIWAGGTVAGSDVETYPLVRPDGTILPIDRSGVRYFHSAVAVPMRAGGEQIGVIAVKAHRPGVFTPARVGLLERIAGQAALAIRNAEVIATERASDLARQDFLSVVSHELRTPITTISGYGQLLARRMARRGPTGADDPATAETRMVDVIVHQSRQLGRLIDDLVLLSGLGRGDTRLELGPVDLVELAREAVDAARFTVADPAGLTLEADGRIVVEGDRVRLRQVIDNLLEQTAPTARAEQPVTVRVRDLGESTEIRVTDLDHRLSDEQRARAFEPFQRPEGDSTTGAAELGLALSIVREIVVSHGGNVSAERTKDQGTAFIVRLPKGGPGGLAGGTGLRLDADRADRSQPDGEAETGTG